VENTDRLVRGSLFSDYVRMIRGFKRIAWDELLDPEDLELVRSRINAGGWYPMESFERLGDVILVHIAQNNVEAVRAWGRITVDQLRSLDPELVAPGDAIETLKRFHLFRREFFNFDPITLDRINEGFARFHIQYFMGPTAEEAASYQALGFFERLLEVAGARDGRGALTERSWEGTPRTVLELHWSSPAT
jgi:hypothetical protein